MYPFNYLRPKSILEAQQQVRLDSESKFIAGGMTLLPAMKHRLANPSHLIDIGQLQELNAIASKDGRLVIGATTKHREVSNHPLVSSSILGLAQLANLIGDPQVRARGTLGGSLANNDPSADYPAAALALNANIVTDERIIPAKDFFLGLYTTCLNDGEMIQEVQFQIPLQSTYVKLKQAASGYALVGVFVAQFGPDDFSIAVTGVGDGVFRWTDAEFALRKKKALPPLQHDQLIEDIHASGKYRAHMTKVLLEKALTQFTQ
ncbi:FAD binding domain-containing protein [Polynucleobacter kasalickyi]|uniref:Carbon-monoxide dehydrogenase medium subunit n=1 Tax=Polynucleobacter kasalickyi TaxID=1938817 RepID=A0A1W1YYR3_9BURK|nr:xanthine dehydrogenase family protein subunit M [Polynucleobacter kasalickyi]SMC40951.1 carbon-monoxide dehydrogenase medium subunit [Polynucleobacter kasalickyi]